MILCSGCFDGLHAGHVAYIYAAARMKERGEGLAVAVASDEYIRQRKGREPYWPCRDRMATLDALRHVDVVLEQVELSVAQTIHRAKPRVFVKGIDWADKLPADVVAACRDAGCAIVFVDTEGRHVSETR